MQGKKTEIRADLHTATELRALAKGDVAPLTVKRLLAIANALEGMTFTAAGRVVGLERQAVGDAAQRYNQEGPDGLRDRPRSGRPRKLTLDQEQQLAQIVIDGPDPDVDGISAYTLDDLCGLVDERFAVAYGPTGMSAVIGRLGMSRQKSRPHHPRHLQNLHVPQL